MINDGGFGEEIQEAKNKEYATYAGATVLVGAVGLALTWLNKKSNKRTLEMLSAKREECVKKIDEFSRDIIDLFLADYFVLDSNVWMDENANALFNELLFYAAEKKGKICCFSSQLNEIEKLKKATKNSGKPFNEGKAGRARHAMNRIDEFRESGIIKYIDDKKIAAGRTHVDEILVDYFLSGVKSNATIRFVSGDIGLKTLMMKVDAAKPELYRTIDRTWLIDVAEKLKSEKKIREDIERRLEFLKKH